jgi:hypothetical protein
MKNINLKIAVIGLGYVGLPLAVEFGKFRETVGFDINQKRIDDLNFFIDRKGNKWLFGNKSTDKYCDHNSELYIYKVLDNNSGAAYSGSEPTSTSVAPFSSGGYVLQYMYTLTSSQINSFVTADFIPVTTNSTISATWPFDAEFHLLLNTAVGGNLGGNVSNTTLQTAQYMEVDYVRVYQNQ